MFGMNSKQSSELFPLKFARAAIKFSELTPIPMTSVEKPSQVFHTLFATGSFTGDGATFPAGILQQGEAERLPTPMKLSLVRILQNPKMKNVRSFDLPALINASDIQAAIGDIAKNSNIFQEIITNLQRRADINLCSDDTELLKTFNSLFYLDLTHIASRYQVGASDAVSKSYANLFGSEVLRSSSELHVYRLFMLKQVSTTLDAIAMQHILSVGSEAFFKYVLPNAVASLAAEYLLKQGSALESKYNSSLLATITQGSTPVSAAPLSMPQYEPFVVLERKDATNPFRKNTSTYDSQPLADVGIAGSHPQNEDDVEKLLDILLAKHIRDLILILDNESNHGLAKWFKMSSATQYRQFSVISEASQRSSTSDLGEQRLYKLNIKKADPHNPANVALNIHCFESKDAKSFKLTSEDAGRLYDLCELAQSEDVAFFVQVASESAKNYLEAALEGMKTSRLRQSQISHTKASESKLSNKSSPSSSQEVSTISPAHSKDAASIKEDPVAALQLQASLNGGLVTVKEDGSGEYNPRFYKPKPAPSQSETFTSWLSRKTSKASVKAGKFVKKFY